MLRIWLLNFVENFAASGDDLKPRMSADFFNASKSAPAFANRRLAASLVIHPATVTRGLGSSFAGKSNCGPLQLFTTTDHPYPAPAVSCTIKQAAAPCRAASSYLYTQRP